MVVIGGRWSYNRAVFLSGFTVVLLPLVASMSLTVSYLLGCDEVTFTLDVDEVYTLKPGESVIR